MKPGRSCPLDYQIPATAFSGEPAFECDTLYVVGGLYGNEQALVALHHRLLREPLARVVVNGDAHWFDAEPALFSRIEQQLAQYTLLRGNVETELGRPDSGEHGCGCAYPDEVPEQTVDWSNAVHQRLTATVGLIPGMPEQLAARPATALVSVGGQRVAISHGDEQSLAGWQCDRQALRSAERQQQLGRWCEQQQISVLATSHTCAPAALATEHWAVINNGAAGMPNFNNGQYGLITRISVQPSLAALYRAQVAGLYIEAIPLNYDHQAFLAEFDRQWPAGSPAALAYRERITQGTTEQPLDALLGGFTLASTLCALEAHFV
ncbi:MAG: hypothetical protein V7756_09145 [Halopseudomonas sp.]|uniref:hypothetical protein n=1 Tax=Halopseudomonas sp. TaxID=2901191 RepID=UPI0030035997